MVSSEAERESPHRFHRARFRSGVRARYLTASRTDASTSVLVVDDEPLCRRVHTRYLEAAGCSVTEAATAEEALALIETTRFSVIITDVNLGPMSGLELLAQVRQWDPQQAVIVVSGTYEPDAAKLGATRTLVKPVAREELTEVVLEAKRAVGIPDTASPR